MRINNIEIKKRKEKLPDGKSRELLLIYNQKNPTTLMVDKTGNIYLDKFLCGDIINPIKDGGGIIIK